MTMSANQGEQQKRAYEFIRLVSGWKVSEGDLVLGRKANPDKPTQKVNRAVSLTRSGNPVVALTIKILRARLLILSRNDSFL